jgi:hypothetical protein
MISPDSSSSERVSRHLRWVSRSGGGSAGEAARRIPILRPGRPASSIAPPSTSSAPGASRSHAAAIPPNARSRIAAGSSGASGARSCQRW